MDRELLDRIAKLERIFNNLYYNTSMEIVQCGENKNYNFNLKELNEKLLLKRKLVIQNTSLSLNIDMSS